MMNKELINVNKSIITLQQEDPNDIYIGITVDYVYSIMFNEMIIGCVAINILTDDSVYIEWIEIDGQYRGNGYLMTVLYIVAEHFNTDELYFCTDDEKLPMYLHIGAEIIEYIEFREVTEMKFRIEAMKQL